MATYFSHSDVCRWTSTTGVQIDRWCRQQCIRPAQASAKRGTRRLFSLQNLVEAAIARELTRAGLGVRQRQGIFRQLHQSLMARPAPLRSTVAFVRYVQVVDALATFNRSSAADEHWQRDADAVVRAWKAQRAPIDHRILQLLAPDRINARERRRLAPRATLPATDRPPASCNL